MARSNARKRPTKARETKAPPALEVGSEAWREEVEKARSRILGGRKPNPDQSIERVAELVGDHDEAARRGEAETCAKIRKRLSDQSARDGQWAVDPDADWTVDSWEEVKIALLMDIRRRLDTIIDRLPEKETRP